MTTNRLAKPVADGTAPRLTAAEYAAVARESGLLDKAQLWDRRAAELGEESIPNGQTVRFNGDGTTRKEWVAAQPVVTAHKHIMDRDRHNFTANDWSELNEYLTQQGSSVRYRADGSRYSVAA